MRVALRLRTRHGRASRRAMAEQGEAGEEAALHPASSTNLRRHVSFDVLVGMPGRPAAQRIVQLQPALAALLAHWGRAFRRLTVGPTSRTACLVCTQPGLAAGGPRRLGAGRSVCQASTDDAWSKHPTGCCSSSTHGGRFSNVTRTEASGAAGAAARSGSAPTMCSSIAACIGWP